MASRLSTLSDSPMLREYAQGAAQDAINPVAEFLAPTVPVATQIGRYKAETEKYRVKIPNTLRGLNGRAVEVGFDVSDQNYSCLPHALDFPVDKLEELEEGQLENALQEGATMIAEVAGLAHEASVISAGIAAAGSPSAKTWSGGSPSDPVDDIDSAILATIKAAKYGSLMGIGVLMGATAFRLYKNCPLVRSRFVSAGQSAFPNITPEGGSALQLGQPDFRVSYMVQDTAAEGLAASMSFLMDSDVLIFARKAQPTRRDPSFMKTFRLTGNYMVPGSYLRDDGRVEVAKFDWSEAVVVTNSAAVTYLTAS